jgi:hypothetical protein
MKQFLAALAVAIGTCHAQSPDVPAGPAEQASARLQIAGTRAATRELPCMALSEARRDYTPPELYAAAAHCLAGTEVPKAVRLFLLAGLYARFDAERVVDKSAGSGGRTVVVAKDFAKFSRAQREAFAAALERLRADERELERFCADVAGIGPPAYFPRYLALHGLGSITSSNPLGDALLPKFDAENTWARLQHTYLRCPK